jgi:hypothetical protein
VNWQHLLTFVWLRWRLRLNQFKKAGMANAVLSIILLVSLIPLALAVFVGSFFVGVFALPQIPADYFPAVLLFIWDGLVLGFLFLWTIGLLTELQRAEVLSLDKFLHLPVSLAGAFLINYLTSLASVNLLLFLPPMIGLSLGLAISEGPAMLLLVPLVLAFFLAVTAVTYQFQGWLASLMVNQRRRRTIIVMVTLGFVLLSQLPQLLNMFQPWKRVIQSDEITRHAQEQKDLNKSLSDKKITPEEFQHQSKKLNEDYANRRAASERQLWQSTVWTARLLNMVLPPGWLPLGAMELVEGNVLPALLGTAAFALIGYASLWRSYRTTIRFYTGQFTKGKVRPAAAPATAAKPAPVARVLFLERTLPWLPEQASAIALAGFRSMVRAPESKMLLLSPIIFGLVFGSIVVGNQLDPPEPARYLMVFGMMAMILITMVQLIGNQFGYDRAGFRVFVLSPASRRDILLGKNLAVAPVALGMGLLIAVVVEVLYPMRPDYFLGSLVELVTMYLLFCMVANWLSIFAPMPIAPGTMKVVKPKLIPVLLGMLFMSLFPLALTPTLVPLGFAALLDWLEWSHGMPVCLPLSLLVLGLVAYIYRLMLPWQGRILQSRELKILTVVTTKAE